MHLSWRELEILSCEVDLDWLRYVRYPHLLFCSKCRRELKSHGEDRSLILGLKSAYARDEMIHTMRSSRGRIGRP